VPQSDDPNSEDLREGIRGGAGTEGHFWPVAGAGSQPAARLVVGESAGTFTAIYGLAWLAGAAVIAALYTSSVGAAETFVVAVQVVALAAFVRLWRRQTGSSPASRSG
jgi:hypothetical protein